MSLYQIDSAMLELIESGFVLDEETGELLFEAEDFEALDADRRDKLEAMALYAKDLRAQAEAIKAEEAALKARREAKEAKAELLLRRVSGSMQLFGDERVETPRVALSFRRSTAVEVRNPDRLPDEYCTFKTTRTPSKKTIAAALKAGIEVPGAEQVERLNLQMR